MTTDPNDPRLRQYREDGQQQTHIIMNDAERKLAGFIRPVRTAYKHEKCGTVTSMPRSFAETYAVDPTFYGATFCVGCRGYFPVGANGEFVWDGTDEKVGT